MLIIHAKGTYFSTLVSANPVLDKASLLFEPNAMNMLPADLGSLYSYTLPK